MKLPLNARRLAVLMHAIVAGWRVQHTVEGQHTHQWHDVPHSQGHYSGSGSMTWTVSEADVLTNRYHVFGDVLEWDFAVVDTDVANVSSELRVQIPGGYTAKRATGQLYGARGVAIGEDNGTAGTFLWRAGEQTVSFFRDVNTPNWTASSGATTIIAQMRIRIETAG
jgi:hypothetical protein